MKELILATKPDRAIIFIRIMVGTIFLFEGLQKFLYPDLRGAGFFEDIGIPFPEFMSYSVAFFEVACGLLILAGLLTRLASIPLIFIMLTAIFTTKIPILMDEGFWLMAYLSKTDFAMFFGCLFLLFSGGGYWSADLRWWESEHPPINQTKEKVLGDDF
jgi:uncharacterized membrane protein YphA (DoxX/SURF4 family)